MSLAEREREREKVRETALDLFQAGLNSNEDLSLHLRIRFFFLRSQSGKGRRGENRSNLRASTETTFLFDGSPSCLASLIAAQRAIVLRQFLSVLSL